MMEEDQAFGLLFMVIAVSCVAGWAIVIALSNEANVGTAYMAPCIEQGYTNKHCHDKAMKELEQAE